MKKFFTLNNPSSITLVYLTLGLGWIFLSDRLTDVLFTNDIQQHSRFQLYKGTFYVLVTSLILFMLIRRLYEAVNQRNQEMELLFSNPDLGLIRLDEAGRFVEVSPNIEKITGYLSQEMTGKHPLHFVPDHLKNTVAQHLSQIQSIQPSRGFMLQTPFKAKNGTILYFNLYGIQLSLEEKTYLTAVQNISKQEVALQNLEAKNRQLTELASDQSHLVRAPLARILAITEVLKEEYRLTEEERDHLIEKIKLSAEELDLQIRKISEKMNA